jgi:cytochrome c peroxidase
MRRILPILLLATTACTDTPEQEQLVDGRFTASEWERVTALSPLMPPRPNPTNAVADEPAAAALGAQIFEDPGFSAEGDVSCATCHVAELLFTDGLPVAVARGRGRRNTPSILLSAYSRWQTWDGAADSPWAHPILALENPLEHGTTRLAVAHRIASTYSDPYSDLFGDLPPLEDAARFPASGKPGDPAWEGMTEEDRFAVDRVVANVSKTLEAFEREVARGVGDTPLDRYLAGELEAMTPLARDGLASFVRRGCISCHDGPLLSDQDFHALRTPDDEEGGPDHGRMAGIDVALASPFRADGMHSDDPDAWPLTEQSNDSTKLGQFRTPSLRGVALTAPYGHAGTLETLEDVILHDAAGGLPADDPGAVGVADSALFPFEPEPGEVEALVAFLHALTPITE